MNLSKFLFSNDFSPRGFTAMLEYFYHGHIIIEPDSIEDILEAARFFHIEWLLQVSKYIRMIRK